MSISKVYQEANYLFGVFFYCRAQYNLSHLSRGNAITSVCL